MLKFCLLRHYISYNLIKLQYKIFFKLSLECEFLCYFVVFLYYAELLLNMVISNSLLNWRWSYSLKCFCHWFGVYNLGQNRKLLLTIRLSLNKNFAY